MRAILLTIAVTTSTAAAEPPGLTAQEPPRSGTRETPRPKKRLFDAYAITVAAVSGPAALAAVASEDHGPVGKTAGLIGTAALILGPSAGHWYAGERFTTGLGLRLAGAGVVGGMVIADQKNHLGVGGLILGGMTALALLEVGMVWDLATLPRAVRRANRRELVVAPTGNGLAVAGRF